MPCGSFVPGARMGAEQINVGVVVESPLQSTANTQAPSAWAKTLHELLLHVSERSVRPFGGGKRSSPVAALLVMTPFSYGHASLAAGRRRRGGKLGQDGEGNPARGSCGSQLGNKPLRGSVEAVGVSSLPPGSHEPWGGGGQAMGPCRSGTSPQLCPAASQRGSSRGL